MKPEERLKSIDAIISSVNEAVSATKNEWEAMSSSIPTARNLDEEVLPQVMQSLSSLSSIDTALKRNHFYGRLLSLTTTKAETLSEDVTKELAIWKLVANSARIIVESMYKAEMFDNLGDDDLFKRVNSSVDNFCNIFFDEPSQLICEYLQKPWLENRINVGLFGKYSSGKTTILNCLYGENFPTNNAENTAVPTYLYQGQDTKNLALVDLKGRHTRINEEDVTILDTNLSEGFPFYQLYEYIAKQNPGVPENRTIIDAPGVMGRNSDVPVLNAIKQCDIVVWLLDIRASVGGGMKETELEFIKTNITKPLFVVLTYTDRLNDNNYHQAWSVIADRFRKANVDVKGYIRYNKYEEEKFRNEFNETINMGISQFEIEPQNPYSFVNHGVAYLRTILKANEEYYTKIKNEANSEACQHQNAFRNDVKKIEDKIQSLVDRTKVLMDHWCKNLIAGNGFKVKIESLADGVQYVINAWNDFDLKNMANYTCSYMDEQKATDKLHLIEGLKEELDNSIVGKIFKESKS